MLHRAQVAGLLTAAGASSRMGSPKALLPLPSGRTLVQHQAARLAGLAEVIIVTGAHPLGDLPLPDNARTVHHPGWQAGRQSSLAAAARALRATDLDAILITAVDQPLTRRALDAILRASPRPLYRPLIPTFEGRGGHPVLVPAALLDALRDLDAEPLGLRSLLSRTGADRLPLPLPELRLDLNTPEGLSSALAHPAIAADLTSAEGAPSDPDPL